MKTATQKHLGFSAALVGVCIVLGACGPRQLETTFKQDPDGDMGTANGLFFDLPPVDDRLNSGSGDSSDWRYIIVPRTGMMSVSLNVDDPSMVGAWYLHDPEGRVIHSEVFTEAHGYYELASMPVEPGRYYFRITAEKGASVYTVGAKYTADPMKEVVEVAEVVEEPVVEVKKDKKDKKDTSKDVKKDTKKETPKETGDDDDAGSSAVGNTKVTGTITLATEKEDGTVEVTIRGVGKSNGVTNGMKGTVEALGIKVKATNCKTTKCDGIVTGATARQLRENGKVVFVVP